MSYILAIFLLASHDIPLDTDETLTEICLPVLTEETGEPGEYAACQEIYLTEQGHYFTNEE